MLAPGDQRRREQPSALLLLRTRTVTVGRTFTWGAEHFSRKRNDKKGRGTQLPTRKQKPTSGQNNAPYRTPACRETQPGSEVRNPGSPRISLPLRTPEITREAIPNVVSRSREQKGAKVTNYQWYSTTDVHEGELAHIHSARAEKVEDASLTPAADGGFERANTCRHLSRTRSSASKLPPRFARGATLSSN